MTAHKAWVAALITALTTFVASVQGTEDVNTLNGWDWLIVVLSAVVAGLTVYAVPNQPKTGP